MCGLCLDGFVLWRYVEIYVVVWWVWFNRAIIWLYVDILLEFMEGYNTVVRESLDLCRILQSLNFVTINGYKEQGN
jgi:hypothetical protein